MLNLRVCGIVAVAAFLFSLLIGIVNRSSMPLLLVRPLIFALVFFAISAAIQILVNRFLPELLAGDKAAESMDFMAGSRIDITEGDSDITPNFAHGVAAGISPPPSAGSFMGAQADDSEDGLGNISELLTRDGASQAPGGGTPGLGSAGMAGFAGMDQKAQDGYNEGGGLEELPEPESFAPWEPLPFSGGINPGPDITAPPEAFAPQKPAASEKPPVSAKPAFSPKPAAPDASVAGIPDSEDFFPDLDSMAGAFLPSSVEGGSDSSGFSAAAPSSRRPSRNKDPAWSGDFNAKDMAAGLRTVLNKEKEG